MIYRAITRLIALGICCCVLHTSFAQDQDQKSDTALTIVKAKPFRVLTSGKRITIQSTVNIKRVLGWTATGHRFSEQSNLSNSSATLDVPANEKFVFIMVELHNGRHYTEKVGVR